MSQDKSGEEEEKQKAVREAFRWYVKEGKKFDFIPEEERNTEKAIAFLQRSERHLKSAKILLKSKCYDDSLTLTQQCVEKLGKSLLLMTGMCSEKDLTKEISHTFFNFMIKNTRKILVSFDKHQSNPTYSQIIRNIDKFRNNLKNKIPTLTLLKIEDFKDIENYYNTFSEHFSLVPEWLKEVDHYTLLKNEGTETLEVISDEIEKLQKQPLTSEQRAQMEKSYEKYLGQPNIELLGINTMITVIFLFFISVLSMFLDPHFEPARYPESTEIIYDKDTEIITLLPSMFHIISRITNDYYQILQLNNPDI
ncbi:MAG: HEPN domain-containing protein [Candidatus Heimdallarchaeaceae archaeon]